MVVMMTMPVSMPMMVMVAMMVAMVMPAIMVIGPAFGLEGPQDGLCHAALAPHHFRQDMVLFDIERIGSDFGWCVTVADMPGDAHQPERILRADLEQRLGCRYDTHQRAVLQLECIAVIQRAGFLEIEQEFGPGFTFEGNAAALAPLVIERNAVNDLVRLHGGFADDGGGAQHENLFGMTRGFLSR
jgi:hypothetical protein